MASTADFRNGLVIEYNNDLYSIVQFQHVKPGKGPAFVRTKLKNLKTGRVIDNTFSSGVKVNVARVERRPYQYLYKDDIGFYFMHLDTFEQIHVEYILKGSNLDEKKVQRAIQLSEEKYCSVSAALKSKARMTSSYRIEQ